MSDIADITQERAESEAPYLLAAARKPEGPAATGVCLWCEYPLTEGMRFCNADCRDDYQRDADRRRANA